MLGDISVAENIYIACGKTDMRKSIDGLAAMVQDQFQLNPFSKSIFLFCGNRYDRIKILMWEGDGFVLLYKRLESVVIKNAECVSRLYSNFFEEYGSLQW